MVATQHLWYMTARIDTISPQNIKKESKVNLLHPYILRRIRTLTQISNSVKPQHQHFWNLPHSRERQIFNHAAAMTRKNLQILWNIC